MPEQTNQHWVPQYFFRLFSGNDSRINAILRSSGKVIFDAPIRGQCAKNNFYGDREVEALFSHMESEHARALRRVIEIAHSPRAPWLSTLEHLAVLQAVLFQKARTKFEADANAPAHAELLLKAFTHHVEATYAGPNRARMLDALKDGSVTISEPQAATALRSISAVLDSVPLVCDLTLLILLNGTDYPFVFSDAPAVFYNTLYRSVTRHGVLGLQTPGLQVFMPISEDVCVMLIDSGSYTEVPQDDGVMRIVDRADISQLNALQFCHSANAVYFGSASDADYVTDMFNGHRHKFHGPRARFNTRNGWYVDGNPVEELYHIFEPQVAHELNLSFVACEAIAEEDYQFRRRQPELVKDHQEYLEKEFGDTFVE